VQIRQRLQAKSSAPTDRTTTASARHETTTKISAGKIGEAQQQSTYPAINNNKLQRPSPEGTTFFFFFEIVAFAGTTDVD